MTDAPKVLLVDDNPVNLKVARMLLEKKNIQVDCIMDGEAAVEAVQKASYRMVLMDVQLPGMDGLETTKQIRQWEARSGTFKNLPPLIIIALTGADREEERQACLKAGMDDVIMKPLRPDDIDNTLRPLLENREGDRKLSTHILDELKKRDAQASHTGDESSVRNLLTFTLGSEKYALDMEFMKKICWAEGITAVPGLPAHILGIINLRGEIISVVDLRDLLGIEPAVAGKPSIMVTGIQGVDVGFLVDSVDEILDLPLKSIDPPMITFEKEYAEFIDGEARVDETLIVILNYRKIMGSEKMNIHKK